MCTMPFEAVAALPPPSGSAQTRRADRHQLFWLAAGVILVSGSFLAAALAYLHGQALLAGQRMGESFAQVIEEQSSRTFQSVDQRLQLAAISLAERQSRGELNAESAQALLRAQIKDHPYIHALWVINAQGRIQFDSDVGTVGLDLSDRAYFKVYRDSPQTGFHIGAPLRSRTTQTWIINAARPLASVGGQFSGIIVASLELSYFDTLWRGIELGPGAAISLLGRDGTLFMRSPLDTALLGKQYADSPLFTQMLPNAPIGSFTAASPIDGVERMLAYRSLSAPPGLVVVVGQDRRELLRSWKPFAVVSVVVWGAASVAIALLSYLLGRAARHRMRAQEGQTRMFERITDAFLALDAEGRCVYANQHAADMLGRPAVGLIGQNIWHVFSDDARSRLRTACEQAIADQQSAQVEEYYSPLKRWLESRLYPSPQGLTIYFQDVSARKQSDAALRDSELRYRQLFENNPQPMWVVALQSLRFLAVNDACVAVYGFSREEFLSMTLKEIRLGEDVPNMLTHLAQPHIGLNRHGQWRHRRKDGRLMRVDINSHSLEFDGQPALLVLATDVTERQAALEALHLSDLALKAVSQGVIITDRDRLITSINDAFLRTTGYTREEIIGKNCRFLQGALTNAQTVHSIRAALDMGGSFSGEILNYRKDGHSFWSELSIAPVHDSSGQLTHFIGIARDISERKQVELTLQQLSRRVLEAQETERRRVARELHDELGQSLTAIKINLQSPTLFRDHPPTQLEVDNIRMVEDAIQQVRRLAMALRPSLLDDLGLIPALRWMTEQSAQRMGLTMTFESDLEYVRFSPEVETACFRVAQEAVTNIGRYARAQHVTIRLRREGDALEMRVEDDGCGFDVADMRHRAALGASMGVLGMQERAMLVGGTLSIESAPSAGCSISLRCPWQVPKEME